MESKTTTKMHFYLVFYCYDHNYMTWQIITWQIIGKCKEMKSVGKHEEKNINDLEMDQS